MADSSLLYLYRRNLLIDLHVWFKDTFKSREMNIFYEESNTVCVIVHILDLFYYCCRDCGGHNLRPRGSRRNNVSHLLFAWWKFWLYLNIWADRQRWSWMNWHKISAATFCCIRWRGTWGRYSRWNRRIWSNSLVSLHLWYLLWNIILYTWLFTCMFGSAFSHSILFICFSSKDARIYYPSRYHLTAIFTKVCWILL